jgi:hypothetical protein
MVPGSFPRILSKLTGKAGTPSDPVASTTSGSGIQESKPSDA